MFEIDQYKKAFDDIHASERTQMEVIKMASERKSNTNRISARRIAVLASAAVLVFILGIAAYAAIEWHGFALTGEMSKLSVNQMLDEASIGYASEFVEPDGTVHYFDKQGNETLVLTSKEAAQYEQKIEEERVAIVRNSTELVDVDTLPIVPQSVTELEIHADGLIPSFALGNGHMVCLCGEGKNGFTLEAGDKITISLTSGDDCRVEYYVIRDGIMLTEAIDGDRSLSHAFSYEVNESGEYCIALMYVSSDASNFTGGTLLIDQVN